MDYVLEFRCPSCGGAPRYCRICGERCCPCYHNDDTPTRSTS